MHDCIIIGAGIAGLVAARDLSRAGLDVLLLEARDRIGGRILTECPAGSPVELGAEFVHGYPPDLLTELEHAKIPHIISERAMYRSSGGKLSQSEEEAPDTVFRAITEFRDDDISFAQLLSRISATPQQKREATRYVEGFNAADATRVSVLSLAKQQRAEDAIHGDGVGFVHGGYISFVTAIAQQSSGKLLLSSPVTSITWTQRSVTVRTAEQTLTASSAIVAVPITSLQSHTIEFDPPLYSKREALAHIAMGDVVRITMRFDQPFWTDIAPDLGFLFIEDAPPITFPVFLTGSDPTHPSITAWTAGPNADPLLTRTIGELASIACRQLGPIFGAELRPKSVHYHNWTADPFSRGAYTYTLVGGINAQQQLALPLDETLFFAGEHTESEGHYGTVHGALASGKRAAREVLSVLQHSGR